MGVYTLDDAQRRIPTLHAFPPSHPMFATLSSFLPTAFQQSQESKSQPSSHGSPAMPQSPQPPQSPGVDEVGVKKREKKNTNETFIVVRPPPAKSNHPLNLQVQLVPPQFRDRSVNRRSGDFSAASHETEPEENVLSRTPSNRSDVSMYSGYSSTASFSSVTSSSTSSSRRMIIPLYNLQAHNVMTNVIVDAGTDAKVAKFLKRGLELIGLATFEPVEVFGSSDSFAIRAPGPESSARTSLDVQDPALLTTARPGESFPPNAEGTHTPSSSLYSVSSAEHPEPPMSPSARESGPGSAQPSGAKRIFGKIFKRKDTAPSNLPTPPSSASSAKTTFGKPTRTQTLGVSANRAKRLSGLSHAQTVIEPAPGSAPGTSASVLQPAVLGVHPLLSAPTYPPHGRPHSYAWVVRRWIKGANDGLLANVVGMMNNFNLSTSAEERRTSRAADELAGPQVEVQFIWSRGTAKKKARRARVDSAAEAAGSAAAAERSASRNRRRSMGLDKDMTPSMASLERRATKRMSTASDAPSISTGAGSDAAEASPGGGAGSRRLGDDGDESDPEDSETPWTCTLVVRRVLREPVAVGSLRQERLEAASASSAGHSSAEGGGHIRLKVATILPTPHHPKVVSMLKVPFPLPDVVVDQMLVYRRQVTPQGIARPTWDQDAPAGLTLTAEEIKDVVSSTALWLVVREGIGGVGKVSRKGDGWRIRA